MPEIKPNKLDEISLLRTQNEDLKKQLTANSLIYEISKAMIANPHLDKVFHTMMMGIHETLAFDRIILFKVNSDRTVLNPIKWVGVEDTKMEDLKIPLTFLEGAEVADSVQLNKHMVVDEVDPSFILARLLKTKSFVAIPLLEKHKAKTLTDLEKKTLEKEPPTILLRPTFVTNYLIWMDRESSGEPFTAEDIMVLNTLAYQAGIIIDNFSTYGQLENANQELVRINKEISLVNYDLKVAQEKINKDLDQARSIQRGLLPETFPKDLRMDIHATYLPEAKVGGDYYDFFQLKKNTYGMVVADVSGHGTAAALIMSMAKVLLKTHGPLYDSPSETLAQINTAILNDVATENFVTIFYGIVDLEAKKVVFTSGGHNQIIFLIDDKREMIIHKADGLFLGVFDDMMLKDNEIAYKKNLRVLMYTDGVIEAEDEQNEMFGLDRLIEIAKTTQAKDPKAVVNTILGDLEKFIGKRPLEDDVTLFVADFK